MNLTVRKIKSLISSRGGFWIMIVSKADMDSIFFYLKNEKDTDVLKMRVETVEDATKATLLVEAFNTWTLEGIREFMESRKNLPKIEVES